MALSSTEIKEKFLIGCIPDEDANKTSDVIVVDISIRNSNHSIYSQSEAFSIVYLIISLFKYNTGRKEQILII